MDALITQAEALAKTVDEAGRKKLLGSLHDLSYSLETPQHTAQRAMYQVPKYIPRLSIHQLTPWTHLQLAVLRIACDLKLFDVLVESPTHLAVDV